METKLQLDRCTQNDYVRLFADSAEPLRWLCYTLTGDGELSDNVLKAAFEQSLKGADCVFREWMVSWVRRLIIQACIALMRPTGFGLEDCVCLNHRQNISGVSDQLELALSQPSDALQQRLLHLDPLPRFIFVLRALEGYSRRETALLLEIGDRACESIFISALEAVQPKLYVLRPASAGPELVAI
jgi:DNA-directed RNA polymerase specialized sigma24 family protein